MRRVVYHTNKYRKRKCDKPADDITQGSFVNPVLPTLLSYAALAAPTYASWSIDADAYYENYRLLTEHDRCNE